MASSQPTCENLYGKAIVCGHSPDGTVLPAAGAVKTHIKWLLSHP